MKIFYIMGRGGSGKDTVKNILLRSTLVNLEQLRVVTTRPMRPGETDGGEYVFTDNDEFNRMLENNELAETRSYNTIYGSWNYATYKIDPKLFEKYLFIGGGPIAAYESLKAVYGDDVIPILLTISPHEAIIRSLRRMGNPDEKYCKEVCRRFLADSDDYSDENIKRLNLTRHNIFDNSGAISETASKIVAFILRNSKKERGIKA